MVSVGVVLNRKKGGVVNHLRVIFLATFFTLGAQAQASTSIQLNDGLKIVDPSNETYIKLNGRLQIDYVNASRDSDNLVNDAEVKRAWLTLSGAKGDWFFLHRFDIDPEPNGSELSSMVEYRGFGSMAMIGVGRHKEPFGMRWRTSIKNTGTPERSAISDAHTLGRSVGVLVRGYGERIGYESGLFEAEDAEAPAEDSTAKYVAFTGRVFSPLKFSDQHLLHVGVGASQRSIKDAYNIELAYIQNRFHLQSEWFQTQWQNEASGNSEKEDGVTIDLGWFITNDSLPYKKGAIQNVQPSGSRGAWQLVLRFDKGVGQFSDIQLARGEGSQYALGVNWFANNNTRLAISYTRGELDDAISQGVEVNSELTNITGEEIRARLQFTF